MLVLGVRNYGMSPEFNTAKNMLNFHIDETDTIDNKHMFILTLVLHLLTFAGNIKPSKNLLILCKNSTSCL